MLTQAAPAPSSAASWRCTVTASGVVCRSGVSCGGKPAPSVPRYAAGRPQRCSACASSQAQVVLPLVPVMPAMVSRCEGGRRSGRRSARRARRDPAVVRRTPAAANSGGAGAASWLVQHRARAALHRFARELQAVMRAAAAGEKERPRGDGAAVERDIANLQLRGHADEAACQFSQWARRAHAAAPCAHCRSAGPAGSSSGVLTG